jgi:hypothetical protein
MTPPTRFVLKTVSFLGLALSIIPAFLVFGGVVSKDVHLQVMILGMVMWFGTAIFWIKRDQMGG